MTTTDIVQIVAVAAMGAILVGLVGLTCAWLLRRRSIRWQFAVVAATAVLGAYAGALAIAQRMFISGHDLTVMTVVSTVAAAVAVAVAISIGLAVTRWSTLVREQVRQLGTGTRSVLTEDAPSELRELSEELQLTRDRLATARRREQRLEDSRRELVSWVSHDLRTPLAGLRAMAESLEDGLAPDPARYHRRIRVEVDRMAGMVDDLFELSRIHAGVLTLSPEPVALGDLVSEAIAGADPIAQARNVRLGGMVDDGLEVIADPAGLARVISNLLVNAIRHTPSDGVVEVAGHTTGDGVELSVSDSCGGLAADEIDRVFDVGWQGSSARTPGDSEVGQDLGLRAGLGLAVVKGIVEAHHGRVRVENLESATGCRFLVDLPA